MSETWEGGYLNGREIREHLGEIFTEGTVLNLRKHFHLKNQVQQAGIDLTLARIYKDGFELGFDTDGWVYLVPGCYWVEFREEVVASCNFGLLLSPRSTLFRIGGCLDLGCGKLPMIYSGMVEAQLLVVNPNGIRLQQGVRLSQALVCSESLTFKTPHYRASHSAPLTVEQIFAYKSVGILGHDERGAETEEVGEVVLGLGQGYMMRFSEVVKIKENEVVFSMGDNPHREIIPQEAMFATKPVFSPFAGLFAEGAVADPGYHGQLNACVHSSWNQLIRPGLPLLRLEKHLITPVEVDEQYEGIYQKTGVESSEEEGVKWLEPFTQTFVGVDN